MENAVSAPVHITPPTSPYIMRNLTPHRRFKGVSNYKATFRPYYRRPWPSDLPPQCTICGTKFITGFNLSIGPSKIGRILKKAAFYGIVPCFFGAFAIPATILHFAHEMNDGISAILLSLIFFGMLFMPAILIFFSAVMPIKRRVECKKCRWEKYFDTTPTSDLNQYSTKD